MPFPAGPSCTPCLTRAGASGIATPSSSSPQNNCKTVRKQWTNQQIQGMIDDVLSDNLKPTAAAIKHGAPCSTLKDRLSG